MKLNVFCGEKKVGFLDILADEPFFGFTYDLEYLASPTAQPLSLSLPLAETRHSGKQAQPYFEGLLPEGSARDAIARRLGIPRNSSVKLLGALGRDCAGDITIIGENEGHWPDARSVPEKKERAYLPFDDAVSRIAESPREEITRIQEDTRLSLAGGQEKIALYHDEDEPMQAGWYVPVDGSPSTHIIKPGVLEASYPNITLNEFLCIHAAESCGVTAAEAYILYPEKPVIIVKRYDRLVSGTSIEGLRIVNRVHQEDCCQACGVRSDRKYEHDGGPGFNAIRDLLAKHAKRPVEDIAMLVRWGLFNYLIGNCDAHAKNISLLHNTDGTVSLAPAYDLISTAVYDGRFGSKLSRNMGMKVGLHENIDKVNAEDFGVFAKDVHMRLQQVISIGEEIIEKLPSAFETASRSAENEGFAAAPEIVHRIMSGCKKRAEAVMGQPYAQIGFGS